MAEVTINNSPVHSESILTAVFGETGSNWGRYHTGTDFAPYGNTPRNPNLYSVCSGTVYSKKYDGTLGNQIIIKDSQTGNYWRYCHMQNASPLNVGDTVDINTLVGIMGATGNVTGIHLHLEYATSPNWNYDTFLNPSEALVIPNERGTIVIFDGSMPPPTPIFTIKRKKFPWAVLTNKIRNKRYIKYLFFFFYFIKIY